MLQHLGGYHKKAMNVVVEDAEDVKVEPDEVDVDAFLDGVAVEEFFKEERKNDLIDDMDLD